MRILPVSPTLLQKWKGPPRLSWSFSQTAGNNPPAIPATRNVQSVRQLIQIALLTLIPAPEDPRSAHRPPGERATVGQPWRRPIHSIALWLLQTCHSVHQRSVGRPDRLRSTMPSRQSLPTTRVNYFRQIVSVWVGFKLCPHSRQLSNRARACRNPSEPKWVP